MGAAILNSVSEFRSVTTEFNRDREIAVRGKGACLCVSLGNVLGPPRRMDIKTHQDLCCVPTSYSIREALAFDLMLYM
ncbi:unnamed protein product [Arctogadus glacialis]